MTEPTPPAADLLLTRRRLVQAGGAATAALYLGGLTGTARAAGTPIHLRRSGYTGLASRAFAAPGGQTLVLTGVTDLVRAQHDASFAGRDDAFALTFSGPRAAPLDGGIHTLSHPELGRFDVFIGPVENAADAQHYEVVVDRSVRLATAQQEAPEPLAHTNTTASQPPAPAGAPAGGPAAAAPPAVAVTKTTRAAKAKAKKAPPKLLHGVTVARRGGEITSDVRVAAHQGVMSVRATLLRDGVEHARAARLLRGKAGVRLHLRQLRATPAGHYDLRVTVTDRKGRRTVTTHRVTLR
jgi:hypothetical protein